MKNEEKKLNVVEEKSKAIYETPLFEEQGEMNFTEEIWEEFNGGNWCFGCSNCNCN